ncbi:MAG TPA: carboxypeptidase-like regulatory domain-containing protein [Gemmatimonadaceae bacterium]|nr:carboxypeptidase-like regulatory domain-containing protein [Gemmatimonadaceae bacterium]
MSTMRCAPLIVILAAAACSRGSASGTLVDYATGEPVAGASIAAHSSGWGLSNGQLVWDRRYSTHTSTDAGGRFNIALPGPRPLLLGGTKLAVEADGYQRLSEIIVAGGEPLLLQAVRAVPRVERVPGGMAYIGITESGQPFGWSFARNRPVLDAREADIFPADSVRTGSRSFTLSSAPPGGLLFLSREQQQLASASYGMFLRYASDAPSDGYESSITVDPRGMGGTLFVRTGQGRFAKLAFTTPLSTMSGSLPVRGMPERAAWALPLPFAYNPFPGRSLAYDPDEPSGAVDPDMAGAAAELPETGEQWRGARTYRIAVDDETGALIDSTTVTLTPGSRVTAGDIARGGYRFTNIALSYDDHGLAAIRLSIESRAAVYHTADIIPNSHFAVSRDFQDYTSDGKPLPRTLRIIEVR